jgi:hypothetical protein
MTATQKKVLVEALKSDGYVHCADRSYTSLKKKGLVETLPCYGRVLTAEGIRVAYSI